METISDELRRSGPGIQVRTDFLAKKTLNGSPFHLHVQVCERECCADLSILQSVKELCAPCKRVAQVKNSSVRAV